MKIKLTNTKDIDKWSNRDILIYFLVKYKEFVSKEFSVPEDAWVGMMSRIKGFREKMNLTSLQYKEFIDDVFSIFFTQKDYVPSFGAIVSEKVYYNIKFLKTSKLTSCKSFTNDDFEKLKQELYSKEIFRKLL
uniref:Uncharacterized protein n=1 Tax=Dictyoglomus turgidum TaxID=513050 RepID=A0A7C3WV10_9BACT